MPKLPKFSRAPSARFNLAPQAPNNNISTLNIFQNPLSTIPFEIAENLHIYICRPTYLAKSQKITLYTTITCI